MPTNISDRYALISDGLTPYSKMTETAAMESAGQWTGIAMVILESLNPDGFNPSIIASLDDSTDTQLTSLLPVNGVLFELP